MVGVKLLLGPGLKDKWRSRGRRGWEGLRGAKGKKYRGAGWGVDEGHGTWCRAYQHPGG